MDSVDKSSLLYAKNVLKGSITHRDVLDRNMLEHRSALFMALMLAQYPELVDGKTTIRYLPKQYVRLVCRPYLRVDKLTRKLSAKGWCTIYGRCKGQHFTLHFPEEVISLVESMRPRGFQGLQSYLEDVESAHSTDPDAMAFRVISPQTRESLHRMVNIICRGKRQVRALRALRWIIGQYLDRYEGN